MAVRKSLSVEDGNLNSRSIIGTRTREYSDIDLSFQNKTNGDIYSKNDAQAVRQAVSTLLQTNFGERPYNYYFGANIRAMLGELATPDTYNEVKTNVKLAFENWEPRAELLNTEVDGQIDRNELRVRVTFRVKSTDEIVRVETSFARLR